MIVRKQVPAQVIYENDRTLAFLDIKPVNPGHALVIPKDHFSDFASTPADRLGDISAVAQKIGKVVMEGLEAPGYNIGVNNGRVAGQLVDHMHLHVMPRFEGDGYDLWHGKPYEEGEMERVAEKMRKALA